MARKIIGVIAGLAVGVIVIYAVETLGHQLYPMPPGVDMENPEAMGAWIETLPAGAFAIILGAFIGGGFAGGAVATLIARDRPVPALIVGGLLTVAGIANVAMIPHPLWFTIVSVLVYLPAAWLGARVVPLRQTD